MKENEFGTNYYWYCPNCGTMSRGYHDTAGRIKIECPKCHAVTLQRVMGRRHTRLDVYPPDGERFQIDAYQ